MKQFLTLVFAIACCLSLCAPAHARSVRHHLINAGEELGEAVGAPFHALLVEGPRNVREAWRYEVWGREKEEDRGRIRGMLFALWRAPGEQAKALIRGLARSVTSAADMTIEILSIPFSD